MALISEHYPFMLQFNFFAGLHGLGSFNSLIEITKSCMNLEQLSLASIGLPGNALALASLPEALRHCHHLKKLRY